EGMMIELLEASRNGTSDYQVLQDQMDATIQKVVLGQTASTQGTPGRLGNDDLQGDVRMDIVTADADLICESFNLGPVRWLVEWNFPGAAMPRVYRVTDPPEDLGALAERDSKIKQLGFKPTLKYVQDTYGGEWMESAAPAPLVGPNGEPLAPPAPGAPQAQFAERTTEPDPAARMAGQLERAIAPGARKWIEQIREAVQRAESLPELREYLLRLAPDMSLD